MKNFIILGLLVSQVLCNQLFAQTNLTSVQWNQDLDFMMNELEEKHLNLYHKSSKIEFANAVNALKAKMNNIENHQIIVEFSKITALIGDGHSGIRLYSDPKIKFNSVPLRFYEFSDGIYVIKTDKQNKGLLGAKVIGIDNKSIDSIYPEIAKTISKDNEMWKKLYVPFFITSPLLLNGLDITNSKNEINYTFQQNGQDKNKTITATGSLFLTGHAQHDAGMEPINWHNSFSSISSQTPLWLKKDPRNFYWFEYLKKEKAIYFRYNAVVNKQDENIEMFSNRLSSFIDQHDVDKLIVDLRWNRGGSNRRSLPILKNIIQNKHIDSYGHLFVIIGRRTFSAAQYFVNELEMYTNAIFVGEPTGSKPNSYGDTKKIYLPNSGIKVKASYVQFQQMGPWDNRKWKSPDIAVDISSKDYLIGHDPALEACLDFYQNKPFKERLKELLLKKDFNGANVVYNTYKTNPQNKYSNNDTESFVNEIGYHLLSQNEIDLAIKVFSWNTTNFPESYNAFDSLGEAYMVQGNNELAILNYKKSIELNGDNENAKEMLKQLQLK